VECDFDVVHRYFVFSDRSALSKSSGSLSLLWVSSGESHAEKMREIQAHV
jgi:hypothetical protein